MVVADYKGLVTVDSMKFSYVFNDGTCPDNINKTGIHLEPILESKKAALTEMCEEISKAVLKYREVENASNLNS